MSPKFAKFILEKTGWTLIGEPAPERCCIYLEAPHTSIWDFLIGYLYYRARGNKLRVMIKKEAFFFPLGNILRALGGFPIDRKNPQKAIMNIVHEMESDKTKTFHLAICPEGTRKPVRKWKTGYHTIATQANIPVYITIVDWGHKKTGIVCKAPLTGNARADTDRIQQIYEDLKPIGKHPQNFVTH
ncbi:MAG: 1-acyl-sn-glycerol-3-phosphate acyltransferase [Bacteroidales bacterium]|nr:1-acyl-sn-glycerol-3-phosphate acyltransferase [Bacteroidales bacterium]